jgi:hypothetical protein
MPLAGQLIIAAFIMAMFAPLVGSTFINKQIMKEQGLILQFYGNDQGADINRRADTWFRLWFIQSGMMPKMIAAFDPKPGTDSVGADVSAADIKPIIIRDSSGRFGELNATAGQQQGVSRPRQFWYWWITAAFALGYFAILRLSTFIAWIGILIPVSIAIVVTGYTVRNLKGHGFGGVNPLQYRAGIRMAGWMFAIGLGMFVMPGALPPVTVPVCTLMSIAGFAMIVANRQKAS